MSRRLVRLEPHPLAGKFVTIRDGVTDPRDMVIGGTDYRLEGWWDRVAGCSWKDMTGNPAVYQYQLRKGVSVLFDDEVVYGKIDGIGHLVHVSEIEGGLP